MIALLLLYQGNNINKTDNQEMQRFLSWVLMIRFLKSKQFKRLRKSQDILLIIVLKLVGSVSVVYSINLWIQLVYHHFCMVLARTGDRSSSELFKHTTKPCLFVSGRARPWSRGRLVAYHYLLSRGHREQRQNDEPQHHVDAGSRGWLPAGYCRHLVSWKCSL